jgi:hypothetical protein
MSSTARLKYLFTVLSFIMTIVACTVHRQENWLEKPQVVMKNFGMTLLEIGPMRRQKFSGTEMNQNSGKTLTTHVSCHHLYMYQRHDTIQWKWLSQFS